MILGVDVGTGGTRAVLIDRSGKILASYASEHAPIHSEHIGWAEQDPEDWWRAAREAIAGAMAASELTGAEIEGVGLTGQMHGCVMLDAAGSVLRPALIWCDQRTQAECDWLTERIGFERLIELTCNPALPNFTLTKLWVTANFKETQLAKMQPKQEVTIKVDALGGRKFKGTVTQIGGATGSRLSLFPPENATGNYVKVVQRIPVRIDFTKDSLQNDNKDYALRPGMSVTPEVEVK